jgi:hypothetical protein
VLSSRSARKHGSASSLDALLPALRRACDDEPCQHSAQHAHAPSQQRAQSRRRRRSRRIGIASRCHARSQRHDRLRRRRFAARLQLNAAARARVRRIVVVARGGCGGVDGRGSDVIAIAAGIRPDNDRVSQSQLVVGARASRIAHDAARDAARAAALPPATVAKQRAHADGVGGWREAPLLVRSDRLATRRQRCVTATR